MVLFTLLLASILAALLYWLLPVAPQSLLSADSIRMALGEPTEVAMIPNALSTLWLELIRLARLCVGAEYLSPQMMYPTFAALQAWMVVLSFVLVLIAVMRAPGIRDKGFALLLVATLSPSFLWSAVVPTGFGLVVLVMTLAFFLRVGSLRAGESRGNNRGGNSLQLRYYPRLASFLEGVGLALSVAAFLPALMAALDKAFRAPVEASRANKKNQPAPTLNRWAGSIEASFLRIVGLGLAILASGHWTALELLKELLREDRLGAGAVILGGGGEFALQTVAALTWALMLVAVGLLISRRPKLPVGVAAMAALSLFVMFMQWGLFSVRATAWRLAHPGWNSILYDSVRNIDNGVSIPVHAFVSSRTEWSLSRYSKMTQPSRVKSTAELVPVDSELLRERLKQGQAVWTPGPPALDQGARIQFLGYGVLTTALDSPTSPSEFNFSLEGVKRVSVGAAMEAQDYVEPIPLEVAVYERYANFHLAFAKVQRKQKAVVDWERRANLEDFAALRKVPWNREAFKTVCQSTFRGQEPEKYCEVVEAFRKQHP